MGKSSGGDTQVKPPGYIKTASKDLLSKAQDVYNQGPYSYYPDQTYANLTPQQITGLTQQEQFANQVFPGLSNDIFGSFTNALNAQDIVNNPAVVAGLGSIENRANRNFSENILPQLRQQATGTGNEYSSKAQQSERLAARDLQQAISDAQANLLTGSIGSSMGLQGAALATAPSTLGTGLFGGQALQNVGGVYQNQEQQRINDLVNAYNFNQQAPYNQAVQYQNLISPLFGGGLGSTTTQDSGGVSSALGGALGGGLAGASFGLPGMVTGAILGGLLS